jgi:hypothetical protein
MARRDHRLGQLSRAFLDGVPLDLASLLLPRTTRLRPGIAMHIHLHAASQRHYATRAVAVKERRVSLVSLKGLADSLERLVRKTEFRLTRTEWGSYYKETNYSDEAFEDKKKTVAEFLELAKPRTVWDIGANTGVFSRLASRRGIPTVAFDIDPVAVELNYREVVKGKETDLLPLVLDLANPSPAIGWANAERDSWLARGPVDVVLALALVHHLAISNNLPFGMIARTLRQACDRLIIEFVPKSDSQVRRLLQTREDVFPAYTQRAFEDEFARYFAVEKAVPVKGAERTIYLMKARQDGA